MRGSSRVAPSKERTRITFEHFGQALEGFESPTEAAEILLQIFGERSDPIPRPIDRGEGAIEGFLSLREVEIAQIAFEFLTEAGWLEAPAVPTTVVDTNGAGDAFMSALASAMFDGAEPEEALRWRQVADEASELAKRYKAVNEGAKLHLQRMMGEAAVGLLPDGSGHGFTRKTTKRKGYAVEATEHLDFRFSKNPKGVKGAA